MSLNETDNQRGPTNDRNNSSGSGLVGPEVRSDSGRQEVSRGSNGRRRGGDLHLGLRGVGEVAPKADVDPYLHALQNIEEALREINQTIKYKF